MKTQHNFKRMFAMGLALFAMLATASADWTIYDCSTTPEAYGFSAGGATGTEYIFQGTTEITDGLLDMRSSGPDRYYWKNTFSYSDKTIPATGLTYAFRMKAVTTDSSKIAEVQLYTGTVYDKIYFKSGEIDTDKADVTKSYPAGFDVTEFHIYRLNYKDDSLSIFIDDEFFVGLPFSSAKGDDAKFVFGDPSNSSSYAATYDWIIWDETSANTPVIGEADYPTTLDISPLTSEEVPNNWNIYEGNEDPVTFGFTANTSNTTKWNEIATSVDDPDNAGNKLLKLITVENDSAKATFKQSLSDSYDPTTGFTVVTRVKALTDTAKVIEFELRAGKYREKIRIAADGDFNAEKGSGDATKVDYPAPEGTDMLDWNVYRFTLIDSTLNIWVNDIQIASDVITSNAASTSEEFSFGDSNTGSIYASQIDWIIWDETGTYSPAQNSNYPSTLIISPLTGEPIVVEDFVKFDDTNIDITSDAQTIADLELEANTSWEIGSTDSWVTNVTPLAGDSGVATFSITVEENTDAAPRSATIYALMGGELVDELIITQDGQAEMLMIDTAYASSEEVAKSNFAYKAIDGDISTGWAPASAISAGNFETLKLVLDQVNEVVYLKITEYNSQKRQLAYSIDYWDSSAYVEISSKQYAPDLGLSNATFSAFLPNSVSTDTIVLKIYGTNQDLTDKTDLAAASGWVTISEVEIWGASSSTALKPIEETNISVYPNPSAGNFTISDAEGSDVKVISLTGQVMFQKANISSNEQIDLNVQSGIYLLQVGDAVSKIAIK